MAPLLKLAGGSSLDRPEAQEVSIRGSTAYNQELLSLLQLTKKSSMRLRRNFASHHMSRSSERTIVGE